VKQLIDPRYVIIAEHENRIAELFFCIPEIMIRQKKELSLKHLPNFLKKNTADLEPILQQDFYEVAKKNGIEGIFHAFMPSNNASLRISDNFSGAKWREYILFEKKHLAFQSPGYSYTHLIIYEYHKSLL